MKRYRVVQDGRGEWGVWDTHDTVLGFASWGDIARGYTGADCLDEIVYYAAELNTGVASRDEFAWTLYTAREGDRA